MAVILGAQSSGTLTTFTGTFGVTFTGSIQNSGATRVLRNSLSSATLTLAGPVALATATSPQRLVVDGDGATVISGVMSQTSSGSGSVVKTGAGTLTLSGSNTYSGTTTVSNGVLVLSTTAAVTGATTRTYTVAAAATLATGFAVDQAFIDRVVTTSAGVIALGANSANNLDFSSAGAGLTAASLGAFGSGTRVYSGTLTPNGTTYRLGRQRGHGGVRFVPARRDHGGERTPGHAAAGRRH